MTLNEMVLIAGMAVVTFLIRYPMLVLVGRVNLPENVFSALKYVPVAVLTAICIPAMVMPDNKTVWIAVNNAYLIGGIAAIVIAWRTKNLLATIIGGMSIFLAWRALFPA